MFGQWAATPWRSGTLCSLSTPSPPSLHGYHGNSSAQWLWHPAIRGFMITMATPAGGQWVLTYPTDPYYPELLPTKPRPILMPHNTLSSWLHPGYKNWTAISPVRLLWPCSLGMVNAAQECALNKTCLLCYLALVWPSHQHRPNIWCQNPGGSEPHPTPGSWGPGPRPGLRPFLLSGLMLQLWLGWVSSPILFLLGPLS
jgi:hypothetical protein